MVAIDTTVEYGDPGTSAGAPGVPRLGRVDGIEIPIVSGSGVICWA